MRLPIGQHGFGKEAQVSGPGHWSVGMWLERRLRGVQVYFLRPEAKCSASSAIGNIKIEDLHAKRISVECCSRVDVTGRQDKMVQRLYRNFHLAPTRPSFQPWRTMADADDQLQTLSDQLDPARAAALHVALGLAGAPPIDDDPLPPFWHQIYFWTPRPVGALGVDGHTALGGLIPDMGLPRRMWAGGALEFRAPLVIGQKAEKQTRLISATRKTGRSGPLGFVRLEHRLMQGSEVRVVEQQDLVFRAAPAASDPAPTFKLAPDATESKTAQFNELTLFRYSALTLNGHRIHYDAPYAASEGYGGLVVNGPLLAQLLAGWAAEKLGVLKWFSFRASSPLFVQEAATLGTDGARFWVAGPDGRLCMMAEAA